MGALARLTGDGGRFAGAAWATSPHLWHGEADALTGLLTLDDVDGLLTENALRTPHLRVVRGGEVVPVGSWTRAPRLGAARVTGLADVRAVLELLDDGATLVLQGLQRWWAPVAALLAELEHELGHPCQANAYLTPSASQGFDWHADGHDVFVVQTHGTKRWHLRSTTDVEDGPSVPDHAGPDGVGPEAAATGGEQALDLEPGHCLYLPRGTPHAPRAMDGASLHVTIGVQPRTWQHVVDRVLREAVAAAGLDRPLPVGWHTDTEPAAEELAGHLDRLAEQLRAVGASRAVAAEVEHFLTERLTSLRGGVLDRLAHGPLSDDDVVARRDGPAPAVVDDSDHVRLLLPDRVVRIPGWVGPAVRAAVSCARLRPADLGEWLDEPSRLVLVRRLVREGAFHRT